MNRLTRIVTHSALLAVFLTPFAGCQDTASRPDVTAAETVPPSNASSAGSAPAYDQAPRVLTDRELSEGWIALFDGESFFGWSDRRRADWRVENGTIVVEKGPKELLLTTTRFTDYVLKVDFKCEPGVNSGVFLATAAEPTNPGEDCYEVNIAGQDNPFPTGGLVGRARAVDVSASGQWQTFEISKQQGHILVRLDGRQILDYTDPHPLGGGPIGLQLNQGKIAFRNIKLKPLGLASIFNGRDLSGWKTYPDMKSEFSVTEEGYLHVKNGRGQLETEKSYGNFILQLECISHAANLNSGIFFRCIPGEQMNGYESQIHNGYEHGDRRQPTDCGTGGIFRRQDARCVVADDLKWFSKTLVADGAHVAVWVNGYQVTDWTDTRPADPNPRRGLRLEPGTIMIQGHDETTNLSFRNLRIAEFPGDAP